MATSEEILSQVRAIIRKVVKGVPDDITEDARFNEDLGADSLNLVEMGFELEQAFNVQIRDQDLPRLRTVKDVVEYVRKEMAA